LQIFVSGKLACRNFLSDYRARFKHGLLFFTMQNSQAVSDLRMTSVIGENF